jgi:CheY-like chemotaxis protein
LKDEFLASMSHELRTPLNAILGLSEALQEQVYGSLTDKQGQSLRRIEESGRLLLALITDILDLSKIEAGKVEINVTPVDVEGVCQASLRLIRESAQKKQLQVTLHVDPGVSMLLADERRLKQMLVNLLSNAVKFTPAGGSIGLEVEGDSDEQMVHCTVWDTGIGIAEVDRERMFHPFVQLDSSLARHHNGTGLGLSLVKRLADLHGGRVTLESTVGQGSRFSIVLPWRVGTQAIASRQQPAPAGISPAQQEPPDAGPLLLLAEDNEMNVSTMADYLHTQGYRLAVAGNGAEALAHARALHPALILMDIQMPGMDGLETTRRLRAETDPDLAATPVIALTALAMPGDRERCLAAGANAYVSKPYRLHTLLQTIEAQLKG